VQLIDNRADLKILFSQTLRDTFINEREQERENGKSGGFSLFICFVACRHSIITQQNEKHNNEPHTSCYATHLRERVFKHNQRYLIS
jgi:hypothetical protein